MTSAQDNEIQYLDHRITEMAQEYKKLLQDKEEKETQFREVLETMAHKNFQLHQIIREIWSIVGGRDESCEDEELPGIVQGYVVGLERLQTSVAKYGLVMKSDYGFKPSNPVE